MKKVLYLLATLAVTIVSCKNEIMPSRYQASEVDAGASSAVTVRVGSLTKTESQTVNEKAINSWDLWVFDHELGSLVAKEHVTSGTAVTVYLKMALMDFYVIANAPAAAAELSTAAAIQAYHIPFAGNTTSSFLMKGASSVTITGSTSEVDINLFRDVARIDLTVAPIFSGTAAGATYQGAYLINVPKNYSTSATVSAAADAWNFRNTIATAPEQTSLLSIFASGSYPKTVYGYPNVTAEAASDDAEDYVTKLVIKASFNGFTHWYPVGIPNIRSNKIYRISGINIKSGGSSNPNEYVTQQQLDVTLNILDWDDAEIGGSYNSSLM